MARSGVAAGAAAPPDAAAHAVLSDGSQVIVPLAGAIDVARECERLRAELAQLEGQRSGLEQRLGNERFLTRAKPDVVEGERRRLRELGTRREQLAAKVQALCGV